MSNALKLWCVCHIIIMGRRLSLAGDEVSRCGFTAWPPPPSTPLITLLIGCCPTAARHSEAGTQDIL